MDANAISSERDKHLIDGITIVHSENTHTYDANQLLHRLPIVHRFLVRMSTITV